MRISDWSPDVCSSDLKPAAIDRLEEIVEMCDGVMVARGDLGVELPPERVPPLQKRIVEVARRMGRPVVVATPMLEYILTYPSPTPAQAPYGETSVQVGAACIIPPAQPAAAARPVDTE